MNGALGRVTAIARKEFIHIARDWRIIVAVLVLPLFQLLLFAYAISFDVRNVPAVVLDQDGSSASRAYVAAASNSGFFHLVGHVTSNAAVDTAMDRGDARVAIVVARGFGSELAAGRAGRVAVLIDGSEPNSAELGRAYAMALNQAFGRQALISWAARHGRSISAGALDPRVRTWYNPNRSSADFLVPGLMVVVIMIVTVQQTAVTLVKERDNGTIEQLLVSPLHRSELILGKVTPWVLLGFLDTVGISLAAMFVFGVPLRGDVSVLAVGMFVFILASLAIGLIISAVAPSTESANMAAILISFLPGFMLSGMAFPLASVPVVLQVISYLFPGRYMIEIARGVFLRGASWDVLGVHVAGLVVYCAVALTLATLADRRRA